MIEQKFLDHVIVKEVNRLTKHKRYLIECCVCGRQKESDFHVIKSGRGMSHSSCGKGLKTKDPRFHRIWSNMKTRCTNENYHSYSQYGGRGIKCTEFENFIDFYDKMYDSYKQHVLEYGEDDTTLERVDVNGDYSSKNCVWATWETQWSNLQKQKNIKAISPDGDVYHFKNLNKFCRENNISSSCVKDYLKGRLKTYKGWHFEEM